MSYFDSVNYLYSLGNELKPGVKLGLERMTVLLRALDHPERSCRTIHVAGTNGKGSTCAMLASILREAGWRTGLYTSPHLVEPTERIQIDGVPITDDEFARTFDLVHKAANRLLDEEKIDAHPSYFETVTAMAFTYFRSQCDIAVIEVGLGGRLDATNLVQPVLSIVTPVSFDHETYLGNTLEAIASEKAGILKPEVPLILGWQSDAAEAVILARASQLRCPVSRLADQALSSVELKDNGSSFHLNGEPYQCPLTGRHQVENASAAILAAQQLGVAHTAIHKGLSQASWPGRLELVHRHPTFVLDGAHNPAGARALAHYIRESFQNRPVWIVFGTMRDKALDEVAAQLFPLADHLILSAPAYERALRPEVIAELYDHPWKKIIPTLEEALQYAYAAPPETTVFFTGSLFVVGEIKRLLRERE